MSGRHVIFGSGPLGIAVATELVHRGIDVAFVNRSGRAPVAGTTAVAGDATDTAFAAQVTRGASVVYQCAQPPYHRWVEEFAGLQSSILGGVAANGARVVIGDNLYCYGQSAGPICEDSSQHPTTRKGRVRKAMADAALEAHAAGDLEVAISRPSDYFAPKYEVLGATLFRRALAGKPVQLLGRADAAHSFSYVPDVGRAMAILGTSETAWGEVWIPPVQPPITQGQLAQLVWQESGRSGGAKMMVSGRAMTSVLGVLNPSIRETVEMLYKFEKPFVVDSSKFESAFGVTATPLKEAITTTVASFRAEGAGVRS